MLVILDECIGAVAALGAEVKRGGPPAGQCGRRRRKATLECGGLTPLSLPAERATNRALRAQVKRGGPPAERATNRALRAEVKAVSSHRTPKTALTLCSVPDERRATPAAAERARVLALSRCGIPARTLPAWPAQRKNGGREGPSPQILRAKSVRGPNARLVECTKRSCVGAEDVRPVTPVPQRNIGGETVGTAKTPLGDAAAVWHMAGVKACAGEEVRLTAAGNV